jgi:hypothetical protein
VLPLLPPAVFDACITDAPYGLGLFAWDRDVPGAEVWTEVLRVMKPGAVLAAFAGRRTYHRLATSAGQEDQLVGRPKMLPGGRPTREVHPDRLIDHPEAGVLHRGG